MQTNIDVSFNTVSNHRAKNNSFIPMTEILGAKSPILTYIRAQRDIFYIPIWRCLFQK